MINKQITNTGSSVNKKESEAIQRNANRLLQLINQLLDLSKLESGETKLEASKHDIVKFMYRTFIMFESMAKDKHIALFYNDLPLSENLRLDSIEIYFDQEKFQKIATNLISNAVKFTPKNGTIELEISTEEDNMAITIANSGEGIPSAALSHVFDRFYQADAESTREYEGTGIGLALVYELVELHHGSISVQSNSHRTTFKLLLPLKADHLSENEKIERPTEGTEQLEVPNSIIAEPSLMEQPNIKGISPKDNGEQLEVLVVEDNQDLRNYIKSILENDYKVDVAKDGALSLGIART